MSTPLRILALDCATATGWCALTADWQESGVQSFPLRRGSSPGLRFLEFRTWLAQLVERVQPEVVVYEQAHHRGGAATELCVGLTTRVQEVAAQAGCEYRAVHSATLKSYATGKGNADKDAMIVAAAATFHPHVEEWLAHLKQPGGDNEADAVLLARFAAAGFPESAPQTRKKARRAGAHQA